MFLYLESNQWRLYQPIRLHNQQKKSVETIVLISFERQDTSNKSCHNPHPNSFQELFCFFCNVIDLAVDCYPPTLTRVATQPHRTVHPQIAQSPPPPLFHFILFPYFTIYTHYHCFTYLLMELQITISFSQRVKKLTTKKYYYFTDN